MIVLRKIQKRLFDTMMKNVEFSVLKKLNKNTSKVDENYVKDSQTLIIAPWPSLSGKSALIEYIAIKLAAVHGLRVTVFSANTAHMLERYENIRNELRDSWVLKSDSPDQLVSTDSGGIIYFASNFDNQEVLNSMRPYAHVLLVDEGDYVSHSSVKDMLSVVPTALVIGTRRGSANGLLRHLIDHSEPKAGVTLIEVTEDDLLAEGQNKSLLDAIGQINAEREVIMSQAKALPGGIDPATRKRLTAAATSSGSSILHDKSSESTNATTRPDIRTEPIE